MLSKLKSVSPNNASFAFKRVDLSDISDVKKFATEMADLKFDNIVWTAGHFPNGDRQETKDGVELCFAINYVSRFIGFNILAPSLKKGGRILSVYAPFHPLLHGKTADQFSIDDPQRKESGAWEKHKISMINTIPSVCNDLLVKELATKYKDITVVHQQPGFVYTNLYANSNAVISQELKDMLGDVSKIQGKTPEEYGETAVFMLTDPSIESSSGRGFGHEAELYDANDFIKDPELSQKLWHYTAELTGVAK
jgi:NAD(P)-dependent dehydrogenase (short-subunit alcohol dehydrogenase family)